MTRPLAAKGLRLATPPDFYSASGERERNRQIEQADAGNHKRNSDLEVGDGRLIMTSANGTRYVMTVDNAGAWVATAL